MIKKYFFILLFFVMGTLPVVAQRVIHIESNLPNARVYADSVWIGLASGSPFTVSETAKIITVRHPDPDLWSVPVFDFLLGKDAPEQFVANFVASEALFSSGNPAFGVDTVPPNNKWIAIAAGASVLAGVAAIHFRTKADNRFNDYLKTGDNRLKKQVKSLDVQSGAALGVMQIGVGIIAFRLIF